MTKTKTKKAADDDAEPDQGGGAADQDDDQDDGQDYANARLLPGEDKNYTKVPNPILMQIEAILLKLKAAPDIVLDLNIRRTVGRTNKGRFRVGIIQGLTIRKVAQSLGIDSGHASRIRARVVQRLLGVMLSDGEFLFGPAAVLAAAASAAAAEAKLMEMQGKEVALAAAGAVNGSDQGAEVVALKPAQAGHSRVPQEDQEGQDDQDEVNSSSPGGRTGDPAGSPGAQGKEGTPKDMDGEEALDKDVAEVLIVEGEYSPSVEREIDLDVEGRVFLITPQVVVPATSQGEVPAINPSSVPEIESWFIARWNEVTEIIGRPGLKITCLTHDQMGVLASHHRLKISGALDYVENNPWFRNPKKFFSLETFFKPGKIAYYASLRDVDFEMAFSDTAGPSQPPPAAQPPAQATQAHHTQPGPGPAPRATAVAAAQVIPEDLRPAWERLQAFQAQVKLPGKKLHGNGWTLLVENATAKVSAVDIAVRYEAKITVCKAEGTEVHYWPSLRTFINNGDHLLPPATAPAKSVPLADAQYQEAKEKALAAGKTSTFDPNTNNTAFLANL